MKRLLSAAAAAFSILVIVVSGIEPVGALTCQVSVHPSPRAIAEGAHSDFFGVYDFAVIGTVAEIDTIEEVGPDYGATTVTVDVAAVLGEDSAPSTIEVSASDPGWMSGYPFESGGEYFIPIRVEGPQGERNYSFLCDPVAAVDAGIVEELRPLAFDAGIPFSTPDGAADRDGPGLGTAMVVGAVLAVVFAVAAVAVRRRSSGVDS